MAPSQRRQRSDYAERQYFEDRAVTPGTHKFLNGPALFSGQTVIWKSGACSNESYVVETRVEGCPVLRNFSIWRQAIRSEIAIL